MVHKGKIIDKDSIQLSDISDNQLGIINKYKNGIIEVNIYNLGADSNFSFVPPKAENGVKTYYILEGELFSYDSNRTCTNGDLIILDHDSEPFNFSTRTSLKVLVQSVYDNSYEKSKKALKDINESIAMIQRKDDYTSQHSTRVYQWTQRMATALNYTGRKLQNILHAAKYHDVGKIYIDDSILNKPSALTFDEFEIMKSHATKGKDLILACFDDAVFTIVSQHHERVDGSGYPLGILGKDICEEAKIIAICDSFDAMTTDRVYKKGKSIVEAKEELRNLTCKYDKDLVDMFLDKVLSNIEQK